MLNAPSLPAPSPRRWDAGQCAWMAAILFLLALPLLAGLWQVAPGELFTGFLSDRDQDAWSYIAKMRQGYDGQWLFENRYTEVPHQPVAGVFLYYLSLGHLARWLGLPLLVAYHLFRLIGALLFLLSLDKLLQLLWPEAAVRRWALLLVALSGGVGWLNTLNAAWGDARLWPGWLVPIDILWTGMTTLGTLLVYSHYPWALLLILETLRRSYLAERQARWPWGAGLCAFLLAMHHPYDIVPVLGTLGLWHALRLPAHGLAPLGRFACILALAAIPVAYYYWIFHQHPIMSQWAAQNLCRSPHPLVYALGFGFRLLLAGTGLVPRWENDRPWGLMACWLGVNLPLLYFPVSWQRLMMFGLPVVMMIWGARGLFWLTRRRPPLLALALALLAPSPLMMVEAGLHRHIVVPPAEVRLYKWLERQPNDGRAVLAGLITSNRLVGLSGKRVVAGHWSETPGYRHLLGEVAAWYQAPQAAWLATHRVGWVIWGPRERSWTATPPIRQPPAYNRDGYQAWRLP